MEISQFGEMEQCHLAAGSEENAPGDVCSRKPRCKVELIRHSVAGIHRSQDVENFDLKESWIDQA
jgi:hypothetical protein